MIASLRRHWFPIALAAGALVLLAPLQAQAAFQATATASTTVGTDTLSPADGPTLNATCPGGLTVGWTVTPSTYATGYVITPVLNGTAQPPVSVSGQATTSQQIPVSVGTSSTYTFQIRAVYLNWTSTAVTTPAGSCP